jgi:DNA invertase Pin-like site-specific DNA recombinase
MNERSRIAAIYARVSTATKGQRPDMQLRELRAHCKNRGWKIYREYIDHGISGSASVRPQLDLLMKDCRKRLVNTVVVYRYDRFARSLRHLVNALAEFDTLGIHFISLHENIDTTTPNGKLVFGIFASISEFERDLICQRVRSGLAAARDRGKTLGRPRTCLLSAEQIGRLKREREHKGSSLRVLARKFNVPLWRVYALCSGRRSSV